MSLDHRGGCSIDMMRKNEETVIIKSIKLKIKLKLTTTHAKSNYHSDQYWVSYPKTEST